MNRCVNCGREKTASVADRIDGVFERVAEEVGDEMARKTDHRIEVDGDTIYLESRGPGEDFRVTVLPYYDGGPREFVAVHVGPTGGEVVEKMQRAVVKRVSITTPAREIADLAFELYGEI